MRKSLFFFLFLTLVAGSARAGQPLTNIDTVVIDAGHGGEDPGMHKADVSEKTRCMMVAQALKDVIERENGGAVKTLFSFKADAPSGQRERAYTANGNAAKIYISLHGFSQKQLEAGIFSPAPADESAGTWKDAGAKYLQKSALFGDKLKQAFGDSIPTQRFFLAYAPLVMFHGVSAPAVAIEAVPTDAQTPFPAESSAAIANGIYNALVEYGKIQ